jgi:hypothetical protein
VGGGRRKEDRSKFPTWISSVDQKIKFLLNRFSKGRLLFQVIAKGKGDYIKSDFFESVQLFYPLCKIFAYILGILGIFPLGE